MARPIYIINGPNLNRLGTREPEIYGLTTLAEVEALCRKTAGAYPVEFRQSNAEHEIIGWIHEAVDRGAGLIINPAAYIFTSIAIFDALKMFPGPIIELHISNIHHREAIYQNSLISRAVIAGIGINGYPLAVEAMSTLLEESNGLR